MAYNSEHEQEMERARIAAREGKDSFNSYSGSVKNQYAANEEFARQKRFEDQQAASQRNSDSYFDSLNSVSYNPNKDSSSLSAPREPMTRLEAIIAIFGFSLLIFVFVSIVNNWWYSSNQRVEKRVDPTTIGKENYILATKESIWLFDNPRRDGIGHIRAGIPADSINNFLKTVDLQNAKVNAQSGKKTFIKKIPSGWVVLNSGKAFKGGAWLFLDDLLDFQRIAPKKR